MWRLRCSTTSTTTPGHVIFRRQVDGAWTDVTCAQAAEQIRSVALGLIAGGIGPGDRVGLLSATRYEWPIIDFAILAAGAVTVPIYETCSAEQIRHVLADSAAVAVFAETQAHADKIAHLRDDLPELRDVWLIEDADEPALQTLAEAGRSVDADELRARLAGIEAGAPATLIYTSGTTGRPKGCQLTHANLVHEIRGAKACFPHLLDVDERMLVFLPLAHVLARAITMAAFANKRHPRLHQRRQEPGADVRGVQTDAGGVGAAGVREGLQHRRTERPQRRQGQDLRPCRAAPRSSGARPTTTAARGCCCGPATRCSTGWSTASCAPRWAATAGAAISGGAPLGARLGHFYRGVGPDHLRGVRADRDQCGDHGEPARRHQGRHGRKAVARQQHPSQRRRRAAGQGRRGVRRLPAQRGGDARHAFSRRLVPHRRPGRDRRRTGS